MWRKFGKRSPRTRLKDLLASIEQARDDASRLKLSSTTKLLEMAELSVIEDLERPMRKPPGDRAPAQSKPARTRPRRLSQPPDHTQDSR